MADAHSKRLHDDPQPPASMNATSLPQRSRPDSNQRSQVDLVDPSPKAASKTSAPSNDDDDDDYTSSSGSDSSDDDDDGSEDEAENDGDTYMEGDAVKSDDGNDHALPRIPARQKPNITRMGNDNGLLSRLSAFLPKMKTANDELQREIDAGRAKDIILDDMDDADDDDQVEGQYIEMNLGLGVLEEKQDNETLSKNKGSNEGRGAEGPAESSHQSKDDSNNLDQLMGHESSSSKKPTIEEMRD
ncbi:hypothetical protein FE257_000743 [Aspergillus nanangensis]|uniref:Uncharacterized protein n=1 Tax=Aspergillus nanangensis TaxID=2582783 RepID=A0AAD4GR67_ASPNN|nr:hypothetical protein FE257_000743 [Aspergillus nanangensis]